MAQNPETNDNLYSRKACFHCKNLHMKKIVMVSYFFAYHYTIALHLKGTINFSTKCWDFNSICTLPTMVNNVFVL